MTIEEYEKAEKIMRQMLAVDNILKHKDHRLKIEYCDENTDFPDIFFPLTELFDENKEVIIECLEKRKQELEKQLEKL